MGAESQPTGADARKTHFRVNGKNHFREDEGTQVATPSAPSTLSYLPHSKQNKTQLEGQGGCVRRWARNAEIGKEEERVPSVEFCGRGGKPFNFVVAANTRHPASGRIDCGLPNPKGAKFRHTMRDKCQPPIVARPAGQVAVVDPHPRLSEREIRPRYGAKDSSHEWLSGVFGRNPNLARCVKDCDFEPCAPPKHCHPTGVRFHS